MVLLIAAAATALAAHSTLVSDSPPPLRFRGDRTVTVEFVQPPLIDFRCGDVPVPPDKHRIGCTHGLTVTMPNPCLYAPNDYYAQVLCHELGHVNGWPPTHGD